MKLRFEIDKRFFTSVLNPHGSDETIDLSSCYIISIVVLNPHGSDETNLSF